MYSNAIHVFTIYCKGWRAAEFSIAPRPVALFLKDSRRRRRADGGALAHFSNLVFKYNSCI